MPLNTQSIELGIQAITSVFKPVYLILTAAFLLAKSCLWTEWQLVRIKAINLSRPHDDSKSSSRDNGSPRCTSHTSGRTPDLKWRSVLWHIVTHTPSKRVRYPRGHGRSSTLAWRECVCDRGLLVRGGDWLCEDVLPTECACKQIAEDAGTTDSVFRCFDTGRMY